MSDWTIVIIASMAFFTLMVIVAMVIDAKKPGKGKK